MFLRATNRKKDGKDHRYFSVVENRRLSSGKTAQRTVLYLGEVNDKQETAWRKTLKVFDEQQHCSRTLSLFPEDREIPEDAVDSLQVRLSGLQPRRPRMFGNCWLACEIWRQLGLDEFWQQRLPDGREAVSWEKVLKLLAVNHLLDPASEFRVHRQWFLSTAMDELLNVDYAVAEKDRLYRCLDRVLEHKQDLFVWLRGKWADLFHADFEVLLYDLTSTYFEGAMEENPKAKRGYSRDGRPDCLQVVVALVVTTDGFPLAYEVMDGNTTDGTTLRGFLDKIEKTYGKAKRMWIMDRGIPTEAILAEMRDPARQVYYLVGTANCTCWPRARAAKAEAGRAFGFVKIQMPEASQPVTRESFQFHVDKVKLQEAELRDGHYLLRSNLAGGDPAVLWSRYVQLTQIESVFRSLKSELGIRPIRHQLEHRADALRRDGGAGDDSNDRRLHPDRGWTLVDSSPLYAAGSGNPPRPR
jgi:hypothetical protein